MGVERQDGRRCYPDAGLRRVARRALCHRARRTVRGEGRAERAPDAEASGLREGR